MYGIFMESWVILKNYGGEGFLLLLYVIALGYLLICEKNKYVRSLFVYAPILLLGGFLFPVSRKLYVAVLNEGNTYYRILWLLPTTVTLAYTGCSVIYRLSKKYEKYSRWISYGGALVGVVVIMLAGEYVYNSPHISKAENAYHLPQEVIDICDTIEANEGDITVNYAIFPGDLVYYVRQYRTDIGLAYGRDMVEPIWGYGIWNEAYMAIEGAEEIKAQELIEITRRFPDEARASRYIVLRDSKPIDQPLEELGLTFLGQFGQYKLYEDPVVTERMKEIYLESNELSNLETNEQLNRSTQMLPEQEFSKFSKLGYDDDGTIVHNGTEYGYLYVIDEPIVVGKDIDQHPRTTMDPNAEFLTTRDLKVRCIKELPIEK